MKTHVMIAGLFLVIGITAGRAMERRLVPQGLAAEDMEALAARIASHPAETASVREDLKAASRMLRRDMLPLLQEDPEEVERILEMIRVNDEAVRLMATGKEK